MSFFGKSIIVALAISAAGLAVGKEQAQTWLSTLTTIWEKDDSLSVRLPKELQALNREYPKRIATVRKDLAELQAHLRQLRVERRISERVIQLAKKDQENLQSKLAHSKHASPACTSCHTEHSPGVMKQLAENWQKRISQAEQTIQGHRSSLEETGIEMSSLKRQASQLQALLTKLESEYSQFRVKATSLERQIHSAKRNQRLIEMIEQRQRTIDELTAYEAPSLSQFESRLHQVRSQQLARLEILNGLDSQVDYEQQARKELEAESKVTQGEAFESYPATGKNTADI
ncbi:MAG: hypothetical protein DWQ01_01260 [Planctomycetota bacterium]|nr:MAG: hypothetical protein DWQ01_01260 [Planctomycetota bacterium]